MDILFFFIGFFSAIILFSAIFIIAVVYLFVSYNRHLKNKKENNTEVDKKKLPFGMELEDYDR